MGTTYHRSLSENAAPPVRDILTKREEAVRQQLAVYIENLNRLEIREAKCGFNVPTDLSNEIEYTRDKICHLTKELRRQEGILSELEALPQDTDIKM
jgi:hypothetical protein